MVYESNYRPTHNAYGDELMHYGVKGMKWGRRKSPTAYGGSITKNGKYRASNGVVIGRSKNKSAAIGRRLSVTAGGRALAAIGSTGLSAKQKARMKNEQAALREYYKVGGDKMLKKTSSVDRITSAAKRLNDVSMTKVGDGLYSKSNHSGQLSDGYKKHKKPGVVKDGPVSHKKTKADYRRS